MLGSDVTVEVASTTDEVEVTIIGDPGDGVEIWIEMVAVWSVICKTGISRLASPPSSAAENKSSKAAQELSIDSTASVKMRPKRVNFFVIILSPSPEFYWSGMITLY